MYHAICSDRGTVKKINQDSALYKQASTGIGDLMLAAVCDGMGGLRNGEVASSEMIKAIATWFDHQLPLLVEEGITDDALIESLNRLIINEDEKITEYGEVNGECGTTLSAVIACGSRYLCVNIGDSRVYRITDCGILQLTHDQTVVQQLIDSVFRACSIPLDLTYTGKAMRGMLDDLERRGVRDSNVLFLHTGGTPLYFDTLARDSE